MEKIGQQNNLTERLQKKLETDRQKVEELTTKELLRLAENLRKTSESALNSIQNDMNAQLNGLTQTLKIALKPMIWVVCGSLFLAMMVWIIFWTISNFKMNQINVLNQQIELKEKTLGKIEAVQIMEIRGERYLVFQSQESASETLKKSYQCDKNPCFKIAESK